MDDKIHTMFELRRRTWWIRRVGILIALILVGMAESARGTQNVADTQNTVVSKNKAIAQNSPNTKNVESSQNTERVADLVVRLRSPTAAAREAAQRELIELGPGILPLLPDPTSISHAEQRLRIERIRQTLESRLDERNGDSRTVSIVGRYPLSEILRLIQKQTGSEIGDDPLAQDDPVCEVTFESVPFWVAVETVASQSKRWVRAHPERSAVELRVPEKHGEFAGVPSSIHGFMRTTLSRIQIQREFVEPGDSELKLRFELYREPAVSLLRIRFDRDQFAAQVDMEQGDTSEPIQLVSTKTLPMLLNVAGERIVTSVEASLPAPRRTNLKLSELRGEYTVAYCGPAVTLTLPDVFAESRMDLTTERGRSPQIRRLGVRRPDDAHRIVILEIAWDNPETFPDSFEIQSVPFAWELVDTTGTSLVAESVQWTQGSPGTLRVELSFPILQEEPVATPTADGAAGTADAMGMTAEVTSITDAVVWTLKVVAPESFRMERVPFSLREIPLP